jgi:hypothetical protein
VCYVAGRRPVPFGPATQPLGRVCMTTPQRTFAYADHDHLLDASHRSARCLSPLPPCTPALESQSHTVGGRCHLSTSAVGVAPTWTLSCQGSCGHWPRDLAAHPSHRLMVQFRANGSHQWGVADLAFGSESSIGCASVIRCILGA